MSIRLTSDPFSLGCADVDSALEELRSEAGEFNEFVSQLLDELEQVRQENARQEEQLAENQRELERLRRKAEQAQHQHLQADEQLEAAVCDRNRLQQELNASQDMLGHLSDELAKARGQITEREHGSASTRGGEQSARLTAAEQERDELTTELELVRQRAAEMAETIERMQGELAREKYRHLDEKVRPAAEPAKPSAKENPVPSAPASAAPVTAAPATAAGADPVVNSVMAQFAKLQKDVARRRAKSQE